MIKEEELRNARSCINKAESTEMLFVLLARDIAAPDTIRFWVQKRIELGKNKPGDPQILEALACAETMEIQRVSL